MLVSLRRLLEVRLVLFFGRNRAEATMLSMAGTPNLLPVSKIGWRRNDQHVPFLESLSDFDSVLILASFDDRNALCHPIVKRPYIRVAAFVQDRFCRHSQSSLVADALMFFNKVRLDAHFRLDHG